VMTVPTGLFMLAVLLLSIYPIWKDLRPSYAVYVGLSVFLPAWGGPIQGMVRFSVVLFPVFMLFALWGKRKWFNLLYASLALIFLAVYVLLYIRGIFLG